MSVTTIDEYQSRDTVATLRELLKRAERGQVKGLVFAIKVAARSHRIGFTGHYRDDPIEALGCVTRLEYRLNIIASSGDDPDTRTMAL